MVVHMTEDEISNDPLMADPTFEAQMRQQRELMKGMSTRESWDAESRWIIHGRRLSTGALMGAAILGIVLILWIVSSLFLGS
jgi:hypothetical protein